MKKYLLLGSFFFIVFLIPNIDALCNQSWDYYVNITVSNTTPTANLYPVVLSLNDSYDWGHYCTINVYNATCNNVTFGVQPNGTMMNDNANITFKVPYFPASSNMTFIIEYTNNTVVECNNETWNAVRWNFYDNFDDNDIGDWSAGDISQNNNNKCLVSGGMAGSSGTTERWCNRTIGSFVAKTYMLEYRGRSVQFTSSEIGNMNNKVNYYAHAIRAESDAYAGYHVNSNERGGITSVYIARNSSVPTDSVNYTMQFYHEPNQYFKIYRDYELMKLDSANFTNTTFFQPITTIAIGFRYGGDDMDYVAFRMWTDPEPLLTFGSQRSQKYVSCAAFSDCENCTANYPDCTWCNKTVGPSCMDICDGDTCVGGSCISECPLPTTTTTTITTTTTTIITTTTTIIYPTSCDPTCSLLPIYPFGWANCTACVENLTATYGECNDICLDYGTPACGNDLYCFDFEQQYYCGCCCAPPLIHGNATVPEGCCPISELYCQDNQTLVQMWNISTWGNGSQAFNISTALVKCPYGCDTVLNICRSAPIQEYGWYFIFVIAILIALGVIIVLYKRF